MQVCQWHHWPSCHSTGLASLVLWFPISPLHIGVSIQRKQWLSSMKLFSTLLPWVNHAKLLNEFRELFIFNGSKACLMGFLFLCEFCRLTWIVLISMLIFPSLLSLSVFHLPSLWVNFTCNSRILIYVTQIRVHVLRSSVISMASFYFTVGGTSTAEAWL